MEDWSTGITTPRPRAAKAGIGFTALDNGFAAVDDVPAVEAICDSLDEDKIEALARKWLDILPGPYSRADQAAGYRYDISVLQAEFSLTQVLDRPLTGRIFFDQVGLIFGRQVRRKGAAADPGPVPHPGHHRRGDPEPAEPARHRLVTSHHQGQEERSASILDRPPLRMLREHDETACAKPAPAKG